MQGGWPAYDVKPSWYGSNSDLRRTVALFDPGPEPFGPDAPFSAERAGAWIDARVPPTVAVPPPGMFLRVTGHFGDAGADECERAVNPERASLGPPGAGFPLEAKTDSVAWCREQFVATDWEVILGPEGRPIDRAAPQLHRPLIPDLPPGVQVGCAGVGMPPLTVRIDPEEIDPVWIETPRGGRSVAVFGPEFHLFVGDAPRVVATNGVVLVNGEIVDPDGPKAGLLVCPGGDVVTFDVERAGAPG